MLGPVAALGLHALVEVVPAGVAGHVQGVAAGVAGVVVAAVDSMISCSIFSLWRLFNHEFFPQSAAAACPPYCIR